MPLVESLLAIAGKGFLDAVTPELKKKFELFLQRDGWYSASGRYYDKIEKTYGWTRILGKPEPVKLEGIFTDAYLLDKITALRRFDILQLQQDSEAIKGEQNRLSGLNLVKNGKINRLYILGKPGAGKTTFLKYIALKAAQNEIKKIPIFVSLKELSDSGEKLMDFLVRQFDICDFPESLPLIEYILETGQAIVLFDGLDETQQDGSRRDRTIDEIRNFSRKYDKSQVLITCRIATTEYTFEEFTYLEVADFATEQVKSYVQKWFVKDSRKQKQFEEEFERPENARLSEMANTPLLLSLLCLNFEETGMFPSRRVEIYEEGINALLHKWDSSRSVRRDEIYKGLSLGRKRQMFARIAAQTFENNEYFIPKRRLANMIVDYLSQLPDTPPKEDIDGEAILKAIEAQHSLFVERAKDIYSFSHLTFQEYFTAKYVVDNAANKSLKKLLSKENITNARWQEVIKNTAGLLESTDYFFEIFQQELNKFANENEVIVEFLKWANEKARSLVPLERIDLARCIYIYLELSVASVNNTDFSNLIDSLLVVVHRCIKEIDYNTSKILGVTRSIIARNSLESSLLYVPRVHWLSPSFKLDYMLVYLLLTSVIYRPYAQINSEGFELRNFVNFWSEFVAHITKIGDKKLNVELENPNLVNLISKDFPAFINAFLSIIQRCRNIGREWSFTTADYITLMNYIEGTALLVNCLKLAVVSNRQQIVSNLLLPLNKAMN